jgi:hypothetical protein
VLSPEDIELAEARLTEILRRHELDWIVRRVDDALDEGRHPEHGSFEDPALRRLVLLIEATERALTMSSVLEGAIPALLLHETDAVRVRIEPDLEGDPMLHSGSRSSSVAMSATRRGRNRT